MTEYLHFARGPIERLDRTWKYGADCYTDKPAGLWVSVEDGDGWADYCHREDYRLDGLTYAHEVTLTPGARILRISDTAGIDAFTATYDKLDSRHWKAGWEIDWTRVAHEYQGIVIAPYQWQRRGAAHTFWYYTWDCSSGCIWDLNAIHDFQPVAVAQERPA